MHSKLAVPLVGISPLQMRTAEKNSIFCGMAAPSGHSSAWSREPEPSLVLGRHQTVWRFTPCGELAWNVKALVLLNIGSGDGAEAVV